MLRRALVVVLFLSATAFSQATAEYGAALSSSSGAGSAVGSAIGRKIQHATDAVGSTPQPSQAQVVSVPRTEPSTLETAMRTNKQKLETIAGAKGTTVQIGSVPGKATIYVDRLAIAFTPAEVRLAAGKHIIEVRHAAFLPWRKELAIAGEEIIRLEPKLVREKSQVFVSFDQ